MRIVNHKLNPGWYRQSPNHGGELRNPSLLVMHFTASGGTGPQGDADYFLKPEAKASAHVVVGRDGDLRQVVPFNQQAWHAGKSIWRGEPNCNAFSIGIEIDNWGKLLQTADGKIRSWTKQEVKASSAVSLVHKHERVASLWEIYNEAQLAALTDLTRQILAAYPSIEEIVGHEDIAPGRKTDPGPAFPMGRFVSLAEGRGDAPTLRRRVIATSLNARGGPGLQYETLGSFAHDAEVEVVYDAPGEWAQVRGVLAKGGPPVTAWVADAYLR
jgi:N-acetylmuramoyl-L-alanine amidase